VNVKTMNRKTLCLAVFAIAATAKLASGAETVPTKSVTLQTALIAEIEARLKPLLEASGMAVKRTVNGDRLILKLSMPDLTDGEPIDKGAVVEMECGFSRYDRLEAFPFFQNDKAGYFQRFSVTAVPSLDINIPPTRSGKVSEQVSRDHWAYDALAYLAQAGSIRGMASHFTERNTILTRQDIAVILASTARSQEAYEFTPKKPATALSPTPGAISGAARTPTLRDVDDAILALTREFKDELWVCGIRLSDVEARMSAVVGLSMPRRVSASATPDHVWLRLTYTSTAAPTVIAGIKKVVASFAAEQVKMAPVTATLKP